MAMLYSIKDLCSISETSPQSIHKLFKSNKELKALLEANTITEGRNKYYTQEVFDWFCRRYSKPLMENGDTVANFENGGADILNDTAPLTSSASYYEDAIASLRNDLEIAHKEIEAKNKAISECEVSAARYENTIEALRQNIKGLEDALKDTRAKYEALIQENGELKGQIDPLKDRIGEQENLIEANKIQIHNLTQTNAALSMVVFKAQKERQEAKSRNLFQRIKNKILRIKPATDETIIETGEEQDNDTTDI